MSQTIACSNCANQFVADFSQSPVQACPFCGAQYQSQIASGIPVASQGIPMAVVPGMQPPAAPAPHPMQYQQAARRSPANKSQSPILLIGGIIAVVIAVVAIAVSAMIVLNKGSKNKTINGPAKSTPTEMSEYNSR